jgi:hypothetical protein
MATERPTLSFGIEDILIDTAEAQLATFNAGIEFWSQWVNKTTQLSKNLESKLESFKGNPDTPVDILLEINEANREYLREMVSLPKDVAQKFISEVDRLQKKKPVVKKKTTTKPTRRARIKT